MAGLSNLEQLLSALSPRLEEDDYVFCCVEGTLEQWSRVNPIATMLEDEGLSLVLERSVAEGESLHYQGVFKLITLRVHSDLEAVGLTAAISAKLASENISANVIAGYYHDHVLVPAGRESEAMKYLLELSNRDQVAL